MPTRLELDLFSVYAVPERRRVLHSAYVRRDGDPTSALTQKLLRAQIFTFHSFLHRLAFQRLAQHIFKR